MGPIAEMNAGSGLLVWLVAIANKPGPLVARRQFGVADEPSRPHTNRAIPCQLPTRPVTHATGYPRSQLPARPIAEQPIAKQRIVEQGIVD